MSINNIQPWIIVIIVFRSVLVMPQWSVAEWRARVGGSWLAIGRPIKSKSSSSSGGAGCMQQVLTMNCVVIMMSLMLVLIGVNLLLRALLVDRSDLRPITGNWHNTLPESLCTHLYYYCMHVCTHRFTRVWYPVSLESLLDQLRLPVPNRQHCIVSPRVLSLNHHNVSRTFCL